MSLYLIIKKRGTILYEVMNQIQHLNEIREKF